MVDALRQRYGFDRPLYVRFGDFYWNMLRGDFGRFHPAGSAGPGVGIKPAAQHRGVGRGNLGLGILGVPIGMLAARHPRGVVDRFVNVLSFAVISIPDFWLSLMLILIIAVQLGLLPTSGFNGLGPKAGSICYCQP